MQRSDGHVIDLKEPVFLVHEISDGDPELSFGVGTVQNLNHQQILVYNLEPCPDFLHGLSRDEHRVLLVETLVRVQAHLVDYDQSLLPPPQYLRFLKYLPVNTAVLYY
jgi:hypothetical protein